ncbi:MAG: peptide chain release factor N(5)-glutamine methyltransferase [bacterium]
MTNEQLTIREAVAKGAEYLKGKGIDTPRLDAELLVGEATGLDRLGIYLKMDQPLNESEMERARALLLRRAAREPVAYILGRREFRSLEFEVNSSVLIPRPETEEIVDIAARELEARFPSAMGEWRILEFGTGSGVIGICMAAEHPGARITATEISPPAAEIARRNARRHGVEDRMDVVLCPDFSFTDELFHAVVANPPYIPPSQEPELAPEVARYEPRGSLYADDEGMASLDFLMSASRSRLEPGGFLLCEIGYGLGPRVTASAQRCGWKNVRLSRDYARIERFVLCDAI